MKVYVEAGAKKAFASAVDWPGWSRSGKSEGEALANLLEYGARYAAAIGVTREALGVPTSAAGLEIVERAAGNATTDFGAPGVVMEADARPVSDAWLDEQIERLQAEWHYFERAAAAAAGKTLGPAGPRGGGRTLAKITEHVAEADGGYLQAVGGKHRAGMSWAETQRAFVGALHARARGELPDVGPRGGKRWPAPFAIRRSAWHALDHAWEIEDRSI